MHRVLIGVVALVLGVGMVFGIVACGGDDETTTAAETQTETATAQQGKTQTATQTGATGTTTGTRDHEAEARRLWGEPGLLADQRNLRRHPPGRQPLPAGRGADGRPPALRA